MRHGCIVSEIRTVVCIGRSDTGGGCRGTADIRAKRGAVAQDGWIRLADRVQLPIEVYSAIADVGCLKEGIPWKLTLNVQAPLLEVWSGPGILEIKRVNGIADAQSRSKQRRSGCR